MKIKRIVLGIAFLAVLIIVFIWGGNAPGLDGVDFLEKTSVSENVFIKESTDTQPKNNDTDALPSDKPVNSENVSEHKKTADAPKKIETSEDDTLPENKSNDNTKKTTTSTPTPKETPISDIPDELTCSLVIRCDEVFDNLSWLDKDKLDIIPEDGIIFNEEKIVFNEGESVFDVLLREMKKNKIHMEFENTPMFNSVYIKGINNLYEFDCGEQSGWLYKVNNSFPGIGCSGYTVKAGDKIEFVYTCTREIDVVN